MYLDQIRITGNVGITGPVSVTGTVSIDGIVDISGNVGINGVVDTVVLNTVDISGNVGINGPVDISGNVGIDGIVDISGNVRIIGTVSVDSLPDVNIATGSVVGVTGVVDVSGSVVVAGGTVDITSASNSDAFGRLRVSNPYTLFEFTSILGNQPDIIDEETYGSGATTAISGSSYIAMTVNGAGYAIRQNHEYIIYQPGKSKLVYMSGVLQDPNGANPAGVTTRIGSFDASMGFYIESDGGVISVVKHNSTYERAYRLASEVPTPPITIPPTPPSPVWLDPLNGTGPSGLSLEFNKAQIFVFDFEWLGVGQVRCGIVVGGKTIYYYTFTHTNALTMPYIPMAKLPLRYEIRGTSGSAQNEMRMICGTVLSEGGFTPLDRTLHASNYMQPLGISVATGAASLTPIFALKLRPDFPHNRVTVKLKAVDIFNKGGNNAYGSWAVLLNPTFNGATLTTYDTYRSSVQVWKQSATPSSSVTVSGDSIIYSGFYSSRDSKTFSTTADELVASKSITTGLSGNSDVVVLCANNFGTTAAELYYFFTWIEYI